MSDKVNEKQKELIDVWETDFRIICHAHYDAAVRAEHRNYQLGIPVIVLSAIVGSAIFVSLEKDPSTYVRIIVGLLSLGSVVLASLQTFLKWSERAEKHREAGARFGALLKEVEQHKAIPPEDDETLTRWCNSLRVRWDELSMESPTVAKDLWQKHLSIEKAKLAQNKKDTEPGA